MLSLVHGPASAQEIRAGLSESRKLAALPAAKTTRPSSARGWSA